MVGISHQPLHISFDSVQIFTLNCLTFYSFSCNLVSPTSYLILPFPTVIKRPSFTRKSFFIFLLLLQSGDIHPNPGPSHPVGITKSSFPCFPDPYIPFQIKTDRSVNLACQNCRSVTKKSAIITDLVNSNKLDILCLTETWLNGKSTNSFLASLAPPNFVLSHSDRSSKRGGGVAILHHNSLKSSSLILPSFSTFECMGSVISTGNTSFKLFVIYRPPSTSISSFFDELESLLEQHIASATELILTGDFNLHVDIADSISTRFSQVLQTFDLKQLVSFPTHNSGHILDLLITRAASQLVSYVYPQDNCISDHVTLIAGLDIPKVKPSKTTFTYRPLKSINLDNFSTDILTTFSDYESLDVDSLVSFTIQHLAVFSTNMLLLVLLPLLQNLLILGSHLIFLLRNVASANLNVCGAKTESLLIVFFFENNVVTSINYFKNLSLITTLPLLQAQQVPNLFGNLLITFYIALLFNLLHHCLNLQNVSVNFSLTKSNISMLLCLSLILIHYLFLKNFLQPFLPFSPQRLTKFVNLF